jgi:DNA repair protein RecO (recombination protein O)
MPRAERSFRTDALILRRHDFNEADRLLTLYTPEYGKIRAIAKGARRPAGRKTGHVELFTRAAMIINWGRELHVVAQAEMLEAFLPLRESLDRGAYANYVIEMLDHFSEFEEQNMGLYHLLDSTLGWLSEPEADLRLIARYFELSLLRYVGFQPSLFQCAIGQEPLNPQNQYFSATDGGVVCPQHVRFIVGSVVPLDLVTLKTLRYLQAQDYDAVKKLKVLTPLHSDLERKLQGYITTVLERKLKSVDFIQTLRHLDMST